jgi:Pyridoxal-phosphate dependent enzyme
MFSGGIALRASRIVGSKVVALRLSPLSLRPTGAQCRPLSSTSGDSLDDSEEVPVAAATPKFNPDSLPISFADISRAEVAIRGGVVRTTCERSPFISELVGANVYFKNEFRQFTGSFKERGARNAIMQLKREKNSKLRGVIAASAGNHAQALAYHGRELGVPATVVMPTVAPMAKVNKCRVCEPSLRYCEDSIYP